MSGRPWSVSRRTGRLALLRPLRTGEPPWRAAKQARAGAAAVAVIYWRRAGDFNALSVTLWPPNAVRGASLTGHRSGGASDPHESRTGTAGMGGVGREGERTALSAIHLCVPSRHKSSYRTVVKSNISYRPEQPVYTPFPNSRQGSSNGAMIK